MFSTPPEHFRIRSFVRRIGRFTNAQERAMQENWPHFGLEISLGLIDDTHIFGREAPCFLEIGFGTGQSLLAVAKAQPEVNFIGVETHPPGVGALLLGMQAENLSNIRVFHTDVIDVLEKCISNASLDGVQIFFPDPWPKRRHHARRLIQPDFLKLIVQKLKANGVLHLATDWEDYAKHMLRVVSDNQQLINLAGLNQFGARSSQRPILTKFERRAVREGRKIYELQLQKIFA
ncbi:MAG: tRNA (guanine-N(7)-)-methyltransferase [uncultured bacterium]|nr:MAG: tRNA (guanine-N(7)-)-methyltransferase [uncultured bacterium]